MTTDEKREFFREFCDGRIFSSLDLRASLDKHLLHLVFLPLALASPDTLPDLSKVALVWEHMSQAGTRSINGCPTFFSCHLMHVDDWNELRPLLVEELQRRARAAETAIT